MPPRRSAEALHAAIDETPDLAANYLVLADHLQELGDPRGELIALEGLKDKVSRARRSVLEAEIGPDLVTTTWRHGFVRELDESADIDEAKTLREILDHPSLRHLTTLTLKLVGSFQDQRQWLVDLIAERSRPALRTLTIGGNEPELADLSLAKLWAKIPRIESLRVNARFMKLGKPRSDTLVSLHIDAGLEDVDLAPLLEAELPALRELRLEVADGPRLERLRKSSLAKQLEKFVVTPIETARYDRFVE